MTEDDIAVPAYPKDSAAKRALERRARRLARHKASPAPARVIRRLLPVLGVSDSAMRPTEVPTPPRKPKPKGE